MSDLSNAKRVLKNTIALYFRMIFLVVISLYTIRVVLQVLGASDYGLNNVVGGVVGMMSFLTGTLTIAAQRYLSMYIVYRDWSAVSRIFSINLIVNVIFGLIVFILAETIGLWFVIKCLTIPEGRMMAAVAVYEFSVATFIIGLMQSTIMALLIADENLSIYSIVSVIEGGAKLLVVYFLLHVRYDSLIVYAALNFMTVVFVTCFYCYYAKCKYIQIHICFCHEIEDYKEILSFMNWSLLGAAAFVLRNQGINMVMNVFFGTIINASRGIAFQIGNVISSFSQNFMKAVDPQIFKMFAQDDKRFLPLLEISSKLSFFLIYIVGLPVIINIDYLLKLWLIDPPQYANAFVLLVIIDGMVNCITDPLITAVQALGKLKMYQLIVGGSSMAVLPITVVLLLVISDPLIPFLVSILIDLLMGIFRIIVFKYLYKKFSIKKYVLQVAKTISPVICISVFMICVLFSEPNNIFTFTFQLICEISIIVCCIYCFGINKTERSAIRLMLKK